MMQGKAGHEFLVTHASHIYLWFYDEFKVESINEELLSDAYGS